MDEEEASTSVTMDETGNPNPPTGDRDNSFSYDDIGFNVNPPSDPFGDQSNMSGLDLYTDMVIRDGEEEALSIAKLREEKQSFKEQLEEARTEITKLSTENDSLTKENEVLRNNISLLLQTAKKELQRKDKELAELRERRMQDIGRPRPWPRGRRLPKYKQRQDGERLNHTNNPSRLESSSESEQKPNVRETVFVRRHQARAKRNSQDNQSGSIAKQGLRGDRPVSSKPGAESLLGTSGAATADQEDGVFKEDQERLSSSKTSDKTTEHEAGTVSHETDPQSVTQPNEKKHHMSNDIDGAHGSSQVCLEKDRKDFRDDRYSRSKSKERSTRSGSREGTSASKSHDSKGSRFADDSSRTNSDVKSSQRRSSQSRYERSGSNERTSWRSSRSRVLENKLHEKSERRRSNERTLPSFSRERVSEGKSVEHLCQRKSTERSPSRSTHERSSRSRSHEMDRGGRSERGQMKLNDKELSLKTESSRREKERRSGRKDSYSSRGNRLREKDDGREERQRSSTPKKESRKRSPDKRKDGRRSRKRDRESTQSRTGSSQSHSRERMSSIAKDSIAKAKATLMKRKKSSPQKVPNRSQRRTSKKLPLEGLTSWKEQERASEGQQTGELAGTYEEGHTVLKCGSKDAIESTSSHVTVGHSSVSDVYDTTQSELSMLSAIGIQERTSIEAIDGVILEVKPVVDLSREEGELSDGEIVSENDSEKLSLLAVSPRKSHKHKHSKKRDTKHSLHSKKHKKSSESKRKHHRTRKRQRSSTSGSSSRGLAFGTKKDEVDDSRREAVKDNTNEKLMEEKRHIKEKVEESEAQGKRERSTDDELGRSSKKLKGSVSDQEQLLPDKVLGLEQMEESETHVSEERFMKDLKATEFTEPTPSRGAIDSGLSKAVTETNPTLDSSMEISSSEKVIDPELNDATSFTGQKDGIGDRNKLNVSEEFAEEFYKQKGNNNLTATESCEVVDQGGKSIQEVPIPLPERTFSDADISRGILFEDLYLETSMDDSSMSNLSQLDRLPQSFSGVVQASKEKDVPEVQTKSFSGLLSGTSRVTASQRDLDFAQMETVVQKKEKCPPEEEKISAMIASKVNQGMHESPPGNDGFAVPDYLGDAEPFEPKSNVQDFAPVKVFLNERDQCCLEDEKIAAFILSKANQEMNNDDKGELDSPLSPDAVDKGSLFEPLVDVVSLHADSNLEWSAYENQQKAKLINVSIGEIVTQKDTTAKSKNIKSQSVDKLQDITNPEASDLMHMSCEWSNITFQDTSTQVGVEPQQVLKNVSAPILEDSCARDMDYSMSKQDASTLNEESELLSGKCDDQILTECKTVEENQDVCDSKFAETDSGEESQDKHCETDMSSLANVPTKIDKQITLSPASPGAGSVETMQTDRQDILKQSDQKDRNFMENDPMDLDDKLSSLTGNKEEPRLANRTDNDGEIHEPEISLTISPLKDDEENTPMKEAEKITDLHDAKSVSDPASDIEIEKVVNDSKPAKKSVSSIIVVSDNTSELDFEEDDYGEDLEGIGEDVGMDQEEPEDVFCEDEEMSDGERGKGDHSSDDEGNIHSENDDEEADDGKSEHECENKDGRISSDLEEEGDMRNSGREEEFTGTLVQKNELDVKGPPSSLKPESESRSRHQESDKNSAGSDNLASKVIRNKDEDHLERDNEEPLRHPGVNDKLSVEEHETEEGEISEGEIVSDSGSDDNQMSEVSSHVKDRKEKSRERGAHRHPHHHRSEHRTGVRGDKKERGRRDAPSPQRRRDILGQSRERDRRQVAKRRDGHLQDERSRVDEDKQRFLEGKRRKLEKRRDVEPAERKRPRLDRHGEEQRRLEEQRKREQRRKDEEKRKRDNDRRKEETRRREENARRHGETKSKEIKKSGRDEVRVKSVMNGKEVKQDHRPRKLSGARKS